MDKRVIFAVAGSGKTSLIIDKLDLTKRALLITYTDNNRVNLRLKIIEKFGFFPDNITLYTYFTFLYSFCYRPFLALRVKAKGINWKPVMPRYIKSDKPAHYLDTYNRLYHARISKLLQKQGVLSDVIARLEKYYDVIFVDEVQDFAGNDFNFLSSIAQANINLLFVGDFFQHTFDTSRDGKVNSTLHHDYDAYKQRFEKEGIIPDTEKLNRSYRCSPTVCRFVFESLGIEMSSHRNDETTVIFLEDHAQIDRVFKCGNTVKLFYQEHSKYPCYSQNWGASKGQDDYGNVCVVLNKKSDELRKAGKLNELPASTKNKLYVACTRARNNLYFLPEKMIKKYKKK